MELEWNTNQGRRTKKRGQVKTSVKRPKKISIRYFLPIEHTNYSVCIALGENDTIIKMNERLGFHLSVFLNVRERTLSLPLVSHRCYNCPQSFMMTAHLSPHFTTVTHLLILFISLSLY